MEEYENLKGVLQNFVNSFKECNGSIRIICRENVDAICGASILSKLFLKENKQFSINILKILDVKGIKELTNYKDENFFFIDIGSRNIKQIQETLNNKGIFLFSRAEVFFPEKINVLDPFLFCSKQLDPLGEISIAGMCYLFAKTVDPEHKNLAHLGIIGLFSDNIKKEKLSSLGKTILEDAIFTRVIEVKKGIKLPLAHSCTIYKAIANSLNPFIPGVSGSESKAANFVRESGVNIDAKKKLIELNEVESKSLLTQILLKRLGSEDSNKEIIGDVYLINLEGYNEELSDIYEVIILLEACIALSKPSLALAFCINPIKNYKKAETLLKQYRKNMVDALNWFYINKKSEYVNIQNNYALIYTKDRINSEISILFINNLADANVFVKGVVIILIDYCKEGDLNLIFRVAGDTIGVKLDLDKIIDPSAKFLIKDQRVIRQNAIIKIDAEHEDEFMKLLISRLNSCNLVENTE